MLLFYDNYVSVFRLWLCRVRKVSSVTFHTRNLGQNVNVHNNRAVCGHREIYTVNFGMLR